MHDHDAQNALKQLCARVVLIQGTVHYSHEMGWNDAIADKQSSEPQVGEYKVRNMEDRTEAQPEDNGLKKGCKRDLENAEPIYEKGHQLKAFTELQCLVS